jgi:sorbitol-specific phosphotransferase system component IIC
MHCFLHLGIAAITLERFQRFAAIVERNMVARYGLTTLLGRNKVDQETF